MTRPLTLISLSAITLMAFAGCTTDGQPTRSDAIAETLADARVGEEVDKICFTRGIDSFSEEKRNSVVLRRGVNDEYLVVTQSCTNLDMAQSLRLDSALGCLRRQDYIRVYQSAFGPSDADRFAFDRCQIDAIYKWDDALDALVDDEPDAD
ncbi:hypothetical protein GCM10009069_01530 [Algimonas arctica]|uniref:Uncharacterized protein n=1 Tax=Algimonas arctica TaxID=1479486 RepID=A0A8J3CPJ2_9PROT|nr:DUF6491 family protein [Algimonas arctica]GHA82113.1 hypothetical protein GCM10009069_01530 [Algimonas arctica]